jgi:glycosyltransferase 2 family protein
MTEGPRHRSTDAIRQALGWLIAAACLVWVFHGIQGDRLLRQMKSISWSWIAAAVAFDILSYGWQGVRWRFLLRPVGNVPVLHATQAVYVGLLTNEIVPLRAGELVRAYIVSRREKVPFIAVIPSIAVERFFDGLWLAVGIALVAIFVQLPPNLLKAADVLGVAIIAAAALLIYLVARRKKANAARPAAPAGRSVLRRLSSLIGAVAEGIRTIGTTRYFYFSLFTTPLINICQIIAFWLVMKGYGLHLSPWTGAAVFLVMYFGTALPNAPSNVGTYQFFTVLGLSLFGVDKTTATGFSVVVFVILTAALWIVGLASLAGTGVGIREIRRDVGNLLHGNDNRGEDH